MLIFSNIIDFYQKYWFLWYFYQNIYYLNELIFEKFIKNINKCNYLSNIDKINYFDEIIWNIDKFINNIDILL